MLKRALFIVALMMAFALPAQAEINGVYGGVKFIDSIQNKWGGGLLSGYSHNQNTVGGGLFVGYDFYPKNQIPLRAEIEYAIRSDMSRKESLDILGVNVDVDARFGLQTLMANFYFDIHNSTAFTPYLGAGAGLAFVSSHYEVSALGASVSRDNRNTVFAWNVGAGCSYAFNENISADLGYRFIGMGESSSSFFGDNVSTIGNAHEFSLGLRFTF